MDISFKDDITVILLFGVSFLVVPLAYIQLNAKGEHLIPGSKENELFISGYHELTPLGFKFGNLSDENLPLKYNEPWRFAFCISRKAFKI